MKYCIFVFSIIHTAFSVFSQAFDSLVVESAYDCSKLGQNRMKNCLDVSSLVSSSLKVVPIEETFTKSAKFSEDEEVIINFELSSSKTFVNLEDHQKQISSFELLPDLNQFRSNTVLSENFGMKEIILPAYVLDGISKIFELTGGKANKLYLNIIIKDKAFLDLMSNRTTQIFQGLAPKISQVKFTDKVTPDNQAASSSLLELKAFIGMPNIRGCFNAGFKFIQNRTMEEGYGDSKDCQMHIAKILNANQTATKSLKKRNNIMDDELKYLNEHLQVSLMNSSVIYFSTTKYLQFIEAYKDSMKPQNNTLNITKGSKVVNGCSNLDLEKDYLDQESIASLSACLCKLSFDDLSQIMVNTTLNSKEISLMCFDFAYIKWILEEKGYKNLYYTLPKGEPSEQYRFDTFDRLSIKYSFDPILLCLFCLSVSFYLLTCFSSNILDFYDFSISGCAYDIRKSIDYKLLINYPRVKNILFYDDDSYTKSTQECYSNSYNEPSKDDMLTALATLLNYLPENSIEQH